MYVDGAVPVNCVFPVAIRGKITADRLRNALCRMQAKHQLLQAHIRTGMRGRPYFLVDGLAPEIPVRVVERRSDGDWLTIVEEEWARAFDVQHGPLARVVWIEDKASDLSELILVCPHCICDGTTGVMLMRELLYLLDRPEEILKASASFKSVSDLVPVGERKGMVKAIFKSLAARLIFSLKPLKGARLDGSENYVVHWRIGEEQSAALIERCKTEGVTVHAALCVALLGAYGAVKKDAAFGKVICPVDIRRYIREIRKDMMFAFAPIVELKVTDAGGSSLSDAKFWSCCRQLKEDLAGKMGDIKAYELLFHGELYHSLTKKLIKFLCTEAGSHDITFSNMGRMDIPEVYTSFSLEAVYSPTVAFPWKNPTTAVVSSFRGKMDFALVSNAGCLPYAEALEIKERAMRSLAERVAAVATIEG